MSIQQDILKVTQAGLRNLYLQIVDFYTESIKTGSEINSNLLNYFAVPATGAPLATLSKSEDEIKNFVNQNTQFPQKLDGSFDPEAFNSFENAVAFLKSRYDYFGITEPPEGLLQIDYGVKEWWKTSTQLQNGFFIFTDIFDYDGEGNITRFGFNSGNPYPFNPFNPNQKIEDGALKTFLINASKNAYLLYADQNSFGKIVNKEQMNDEYFFILDEGRNSIYSKIDSSGKTGKIYIRTFFNEFGQKLDASLIEVQGVSELKKIPGGIRKNYIVKNLLSGIDAFEKDQKKDGTPSAKSLEIIKDLKEVKKLINKSIKDKQISKNSTIGFVFSEDYEFISALNEENKLINNFELYRFLKNKKETNKYITRLNAINCRLVGSPLGPPTAELPYGTSAENYNHFTSGGQSFGGETSEQKAANYYLEQNTLKNIGDAAMQVLYDEMKKYVPAEVAEIYNTVLHRLDIAQLLEIFSSLKSKVLTVEQLRKMFFRTFIEGLDITELIDCVVENAGVPQEQRRTEVSPAYDDNGKPIGNATKTYTSQTNLDFELDLKTILYGKFSFFYNIAKSFDSDLFDFPDGGSGLPSAQDKVNELSNASAQLQEQKPGLEQNIELYNSNLQQWSAPGATVPPASVIAEYEENLLFYQNELAVLEQDVINAQANLRSFLNTNFMYILMIPPSQSGMIYSTIVANDPQYKYKPRLINAGMLEARDSAIFTPEAFIEVLFKNEIYKYAFGLPEPIFIDFYDNIAKNNKRLKTTEELKKDLANGMSAEDIAKSAKLSQVKLPKVPTFDMFLTRFPTFSMDAAFSPLLKAAFDAAMKAALSPMSDAAKAAMDDSYNGSEDSWNRLDPNLKAEYTSNDPVQNALDGFLSGYASPLEVYLKAQSDVFPSNSVEEIQCLFEKIHSELEVQVQLKFLSGTVEEDSTSITIVRNMFLGCGLDGDFTTIVSFFSWLRDLLGSTGGLDLILQKIQDAQLASLLNTDICEDNADADNIDDIIASNDSREAIKALEEILGLLNDNKRNSLMPPIFGCSGNTGKSSVFPDFYSAPTRDSLDKHVSGVISGINEVFNNDISKFKSIILKQGVGPNELLSQLFGPDEQSQRENVQDFLSKIANFAQTGQGPNGVDTEQYEAKQKNLKIILESLFSANPPKLTLYDQNENISVCSFEYSGYENVSGGVVYTYELITNKSDQEQEYKSTIVNANSTYLIFFIKKGDQSENIILFKNLSLGESAIFQPGEDIFDLYKKLIQNNNPLYYGPGQNELFTVDYPQADISGGDPYFYSQRLLSYLQGATGFAQIEDFELGNKSLLETIMSSLFLNFINQVSIFNNQNFNSIPLEDKGPAIRTGRDGILLTDSIFKKYKDLRKTYQCFLNFNSNPDAHKISNLKALYKLLFNTLIIEGLMKNFFNLGQQQLSLANNEVMKSTIVSGIRESFERSATRIANLQPNYEYDIDLLYKFQVLEEKLRDGPNNAADYLPDGTLDPESVSQQPNQWNLQTTTEKIIYLASEYYDDIVGRLKDRILFSNPNLQSFDLENKANVFNDTPAGSSLFKMYDLDQTTSAIPTLTGLKKGLILQEYIDVRQNGSIIQQFKEGTLKGNYASYENKSKNDFIVDITENFLPGVDLIFGNKLYEGVKVDQEAAVNGVATVGYTNPFFTRQQDLNFNDALALGVAAPKINLNGNQSDIDVPGEYVFENAIYALNWLSSFYRTQGKITKEDYLQYYAFQNQFSIVNAAGTNQASYFAKQGPKMYFKKASAGVRLSMVVPTDSNPSTAALLTKFLNITSEKSKVIEGKEIFKEKFGVYKNENGETFLVIPLMQKEEDFLDDLWSEWANSKDESAIFLKTSGWIKKMYERVENYNFESLKNDLIQQFNNQYPATDTFAQTIPITIFSLVDEEYGEELLNLFNPTKEEILKSIKMLKGLMNGEWDMDINDLEIPEMDIYAALAFSLIPILVKLLATFVDPTWNTPWFFPGPLNPVGFAAKILDAAS
jgi:hypothetical protein